MKTCQTLTSYTEKYATGTNSLLTSYIRIRYNSTKYQAFTLPFLHIVQNLVLTQPIDNHFLKTISFAYILLITF